jgi:hypothetical protein
MSLAEFGPVHHITVASLFRRGLYQAGVNEVPARWLLAGCAYFRRRRGLAGRRAVSLLRGCHGGI